MRHYRVFPLAHLGGAACLGVVLFVACGGSGASAGGAGGGGGGGGTLNGTAQASTPACGVRGVRCAFSSDCCGSSLVYGRRLRAEWERNHLPVLDQR